MMQRLASVFMALLLVPVLAGAVVDFQSIEEETRFRELAEELRCMVCQNQSLADSGAGLAQDLRMEVLRLMRDGRSDEEIKAYLAERYGDFVLYRPPVKPATWPLWFGPIVLFLIAAGALVYTVRRRASPSAMMADPDQQELDRRLEEEQP